MNIIQSNKCFDNLAQVILAHPFWKHEQIGLTRSVDRAFLPCKPTQPCALEL